MDSAEAAKRSKIRPTFRDWITEKTFPLLSAAEAALKEEGMRSRCRKNDLKFATKIYYRCKHVKRTGTQCPSAVYLRVDSSTLAVTLFRTAANHEHEGNAGAGIPQHIREIISKLIEQNFKPLAIMYILRIEGFALPTKTELDNFMSRLRHKYGGTASTNRD